jgi:peroxiredoxin
MQLDEGGNIYLNYINASQTVRCAILDINALNAKLLFSNGDNKGEINFGNSNHGIRRSGNNVQVWSSGGDGSVDFLTDPTVNGNRVVRMRVEANGSGVSILEGTSYKTGRWKVISDGPNFQLAFRFDDIGKGYIWINGGSHQLNFTGMHRCLVTDCHERNLQSLLGLIVVAKNDDYLSMDNGLRRGIDSIVIDECLPIVSLAGERADCRVFGVIGNAEPSNRQDTYGAFVTPFDKPRGDSRSYINAVGEGAIWVCDEDGPLASGDAVVSSNVTGYGTRQGDDFMRTSTVAKLTMSCDFNHVSVPKQRLKQEQFEDIETVMIEVTAEDTSEVKFINGKYVLITTPGAVSRVPKRVTVPIHDEAGTLLYEQEVDEQRVVTSSRNVIDHCGNAVWEDDVTDDGSVVVEPRYKMRWLLADGTQITQDEYTGRKAMGEAVYRAAFLGCTYHCG